jgi:hypothetical protein
MTNPRPTWESIWLACLSCKHEWDDWQPIGVRVETWIAHVGTFRCPLCGKGASSVTLRSTRLPEDTS